MSVNVTLPDAPWPVDTMRRVIHHGLTRLLGTMEQTPDFSCSELAELHYARRYPMMAIGGTDILPAQADYEICINYSVTDELPIAFTQLGRRRLEIRMGTPFPSENQIFDAWRTFDDDASGPPKRIAKEIANAEGGRLTTRAVYFVPADHRWLKHSIGWIAEYAAARGASDLSLAAPANLADDLAAQFPEYDVVVDIDAFEMMEFGIWIIEGFRNHMNQVKAPGNENAHLGKRLFVCDEWGFILPANVAAEGQVQIATGKREVYAHKGVFPKIGYREVPGQFPFPYYFFTTPSASIGRQDEFGFRIDRDIYALAERDENHKLIAVFGGSTTIDLSCTDDHLYTNIIEAKLNAECRGTERDLKFTVLNFGMSEGVVLTSLTSYMLFCHRLHPDIVISHDPVNDLTHGLITDPNLLNKYQITYRSSAETWLQRLMETPEDLPLQDYSKGSTARILNTPDGVIDAYLERKTQFMEIVTGLGGVFLWGHQPMWFSKKPSPYERAMVDNFFASNDFWRDASSKLPQLWQMLEDKPKPPPEQYVDLHAYFSRYGADDDFFHDTCHVTPNGAHAVAQCYFEHIRDHNLKGW